MPKKKDEKNYTYDSWLARVIEVKDFIAAAKTAAAGETR